MYGHLELFVINLLQEIHHGNLNKIKYIKNYKFINKYLNMYKKVFNSWELIFHNNIKNLLKDVYNLKKKID